MVQINNGKGQLDIEELEILEAYEEGKLDDPPVPDDMVFAAKKP